MKILVYAISLSRALMFLSVAIMVVFDDPVLDIKNENYLFLRFYLPLLDCDDCRSFELDLIIFQFIPPLVSGCLVNCRRYRDSFFTYFCTAFRNETSIQLIPYLRSLMLVNLLRKKIPDHLLR